MGKLFRRTSWKRALGLTKAKMDLKRSLGVYKVTKITNAPKNAARRFKRHHPIINALLKLLKKL